MLTPLEIFLLATNLFTLWLLKLAKTPDKLVIYSSKLVDEYKKKCFNLARDNKRLNREIEELKEELNQKGN